MSNVLVTGASGFLGATVVARLLEAGHSVIQLDGTLSTISQTDGA